MTDQSASTAPIGDVENNDIIPQTKEKSTPLSEKSFDTNRTNEERALTKEERKVYEEFKSESYAFAVQDILENEKVIRIIPL